MKISMVMGVILAMPVILWQVWAFIAPGLHKHERRFAGPFVIIGSVLFLLGASFALLVVMPFGVERSCTYTDWEVPAGAAPTARRGGLQLRLATIGGSQKYGSAGSATNAACLTRRSNSRRHCSISLSSMGLPLVHPSHSTAGP